MQTATAMIEWYVKALKRFVTTMFDSLGLKAGEVVSSMSDEQRRGIMRVLRPAESAVLRLIVFLEKGIVLPDEEETEKKPPKRDKARNSEKAASSSASKTRRDPLFALYETQIYLMGEPVFFEYPCVRTGVPPRCLGLGPFDRMPPAPPKRSKPEPLSPAERLCRRMYALYLALQDLPAQAERLARMQRRKEQKARKGRIVMGPLRIGRAPGWRDDYTHPVDRALHDCERFARLEPYPHDPG